MSKKEQIVANSHLGYVVRPVLGVEMRRHVHGEVHQLGNSSADAVVSFAEIIALIGFFKFSDEERTIHQMVVPEIVMDVTEVPRLDSCERTLVLPRARPSNSKLTTATGRTLHDPRSAE